MHELIYRFWSRDHFALAWDDHNLPTPPWKIGSSKALEERFAKFLFCLGCYRLSPNERQVDAPDRDAPADERALALSFTAIHVSLLMVKASVLPLIPGTPEGQSQKSCWKSSPVPLVLSHASRGRPPLPATRQEREGRHRRAAGGPAGRCGCRPTDGEWRAAHPPRLEGGRAPRLPAPLPLRLVLRSSRTEAIPRTRYPSPRAPESLVRGTRQSSRWSTPAAIPTTSATPPKSRSSRPLGSQPGRSRCPLNAASSGRRRRRPRRCGARSGASAGP